MTVVNASRENVLGVLLGAKGVVTNFLVGR